MSTRRSTGSKIPLPRPQEEKITLTIGGVVHEIDWPDMTNRVRLIFKSETSPIDVLNSVFLAGYMQGARHQCAGSSSKAPMESERPLSG
jgi:hypothetical protein